MNYFGMILGILSTISSTAFGATPTADQILSAAERIRNPSDDYRTFVSLKDQQDGKSEVRTYECLIKGRHHAIVNFLTPEADRGTKILMVDEQMYLSTASSAKPVHISPRQKLAGNAAYGDVVRLNFVGNYTPTLTGTEAYAKGKAYVLDLAAIDGKAVTYERVRYWVDVQSYRPVKAWYQTTNGKTLREGYFDGYANVLGVQRPTKVTLIDHLVPKHVTTLVFSGAKKRKFNDLLFSKQNFNRDTVQ